MSALASINHLYIPRTTVLEQAAILAEVLRDRGRASFRELTANCEDTYVVVARFLAVLDLYRDRRVLFDQAEPLGDLFISWVGEPEPEDGGQA